MKQTITFTIAVLLLSPLLSLPAADPVSKKGKHKKTTHQEGSK
jgi:hypothetical protein